jgi:parallel beta-helix repeat protein
MRTQRSSRAFIARFGAARRLFLSIVILAALVGIAALVPTGWSGSPRSVSAATLCVNPGGTGGCFNSVQAAVNAAALGDTINVAAGNYNETVTVNKSLIINGAQAGVDARARLGSESVMTAAGGGFFIVANNVTIDGFTIQNTTGGLAAGIVVAGGVSGSKILNNIIQNNVFGIYLSGSGNLVQQNFFRNNTQPGGASGNGIYSELTLTNNTIDNNRFVGHDSSAMVIVGPNNANISFTNNEVLNQAGIGLFNTNGATISDNRFINCTTSCILLGGNDNNITITRNVLIGPGDANAHNGVTIGDSLGFGPNGPIINITDNTFDGLDCAIVILSGTNNTPDQNQPGVTCGTEVEVHNNRIVHSVHTGIFNETVNCPAGFPKVDATGNWWGCNDAPDAGACNCNGTGPGGLGDTEGANINTSGWLTLQLTVNPNPVTLGFSATVTAQITGIGAPITPVIFAATNGTITPTQANIDPATDQATATYNANVAAGTSTISATVDCQTLEVTENVQDNAGGPGEPTPDRAEISDQKPGSILFFNIYSSSIANPGQENTRINFTNTNPNLMVFVHLYFVDGATCSVADAFICLTPNQTATLNASDVDPGIRGYVVMVATDSNGCPIKFNYLIGDEYVKLLQDGELFATNLAAESIAAIAGVDGQVTACDANLNPPQVAIRFDGTMYNRVPRVLALDSIMSPADGNSTLLIVNRIGGSLLVSGNSIGNLFGILYDDLENPKSFALSGGCQYSRIIRHPFPRTTPRFDQFITSGHTGWMRFWRDVDGGLFGASINSNRGVGGNPSAFNHGHNLHKLTRTTESYLLPIFPPSCN